MRTIPRAPRERRWGSPWVRHSSSSSRRPRRSASAPSWVRDFIVDSSIGHIRDLPRGADEVPEAYKKESWARLGVDVDNGFKPLYVVSQSKKSVVTNLKRLLKGADELYLATDEDREGESIAWHLLGGAVADGAGQAHGLPRDHPDRHRPGGGGMARSGPPPGRRPGGPANPRPALRLRGLAGAVAQGHAQALGRPGAERGHPHGGRARAGPHEVPVRHLVGRGGHVHQRRPTPRRPSAPPWCRWPARRWPPARTSTTTASRPASRPCACWAKRRPPRWPPPWPVRPSR